MTRYYNLEANNNNNNNGSMMGVGVKEMSKPMKLGQPIDGRLGKTPLSAFMNQWQIKSRSEQFNKLASSKLR